MKKLRNPFVTGGYVSSRYFCDRERETAEIVRNLTNGNNMAVISPRRMGKTGLIEHCFAKTPIKQQYYTFFVDIYATSNLREFVHKFGREIFERLKPRGRKFVENFFAAISSLRPAFKLDPVTGAPTFDIGAGDIRQAEFTLEEIFGYLETADKPCIVAIDEFQQIDRYPEKNIEATLRTHIQRCRNTTFVFAGSSHHMMQTIFFTSSRPFYQSAGFLQLDAIPREEYVKFIARNFKEGGKVIPAALAGAIYDYFWGHTWYIQNICNELFALTEKGETCISELAGEAIEARINSYVPLFENTLHLLSERQREVLYAIARDGRASEMTSAKFISRHGLLSASSVQTAVKQLIDKEIITAEGKEHLVYDRFFGLWLSGNHTAGVFLNPQPHNG